MKKQILLLLMLFLPSMAGAYDIEIDKVLYNCDATTKTATVTYQEYKEGYGDINNVSTGEITIPSEIQYEGDTYRVTSIGNCAFYGCSDLSVTIDKSEPSIIMSRTVFEAVQASATLYVPKDSLATYKANSKWNKFKEIKEFVIGDVNDDGVVDGKDLQAMTGRVMEKKPEGAFLEGLADANRNGKVDVGDVVYLIKLMESNE